MYLIIECDTYNVIMIFNLNGIDKILPPDTEQVSLNFEPSL